LATTFRLWSRDKGDDVVVVETVVDEEGVDAEAETSEEEEEEEEEEDGNELFGTTESRVEAADGFDPSTSSCDMTASTAFVKALYRSKVSTGSGSSRRKALRRPQTV
jgi:hypothetical protein